MRPQPSYDQPAYEQPSYDQPSYGQPSYDQPFYRQGPPVSTVPADVGAAPPPVSPNGRSGGFRRWPPVLTAVGVLVLVLVAIAQFIVLRNTDSELGRTQRSLAAQNKDIGALHKGQAADARRTTALEAQAKGTLNPATVAKHVLPSVFRVRAGDEIGTAFALGKAPNGGGTLLITNYHVIANEQASGGSDVTLEQGANTSYPGKILRGDETHDLAVILLGKTVPLLKAAGKQIQPGDPVVAIGSPLGLTNTVTSGIVSGLRTVPGLESEGEKIQFDAAINPGNSGGPVVNATGEVVGVAQIKIIGQDKTAEGLALAIPITEVCQDLISC